MLLSLLLIPMIGVLAILIYKNNGYTGIKKEENVKTIKSISLAVSSLNLFISLVLFILFDFSTNQFQFVQEYHEISYFDFYLGVDGLSIYFVLLTTLIMPISLVSK
jgi:NADH:ubiquinone oxidoreductase subunit 4 (subunit M)